jgi:uncharacterized RDD family membrane protein YckC
MTEELNEEKNAYPGGEKDLRSIMSGRAGALGHGGQAGTAVRPSQTERTEQPAPGQRGEAWQERREEPKPVKLPPVWPGDEKQPWFRRERGMEPLPDDRRQPDYLREDFPTETVDVATRAMAWVMAVLIPGVMSFVAYAGISFIGTLLLLGNVILYRQGQDIGALLFRMRVLRDNGDVAGFYHMWTRAFASLVSLLPLGAGYWSVLSDPKNGRTWHDRWMGTYVVKDSPEYRERARSSSDIATKWFWVTLLLVIAMILLTALAYASVDPGGTQPTVEPTAQPGG